MNFADSNMSFVEQRRSNVFRFSDRSAATGVRRERPGVAIVGALGTTCNHLIDVCQHQGIYFRIFPDIRSLEQYSAQPTMSLAILIGHPQDETMRTLMSSLQQCGVQRTVLVGPAVGMDSYLLALEEGFDEVWPEALGAQTLRALVNKSWQTTLRFFKPMVEQVSATQDIVLRPEACSCAVGGTVAYLSRSCFVVLQCLVLRHPEVVSRTELLGALGRVVPGLDDRSRAIDMAIYRLRRQLSAARLRDIEIRTVDHIGYGLSLAEKH